jgi:phosphate transport system substrate-binding protein
VQVEIHAHGSSTGFADLNTESTDIAMSSRRIKNEEVTELADRYGDLSQVSGEHVLALDGLAIIVHPALSIQEMNTATIADLFSGKIQNWKSLGGPDLPVKRFARDENSGTWDTFESLVLKPNKQELASDAVRFESSNALSDEVSVTPGAIGFIGLPYVRQSKLIAVSEGGGALPVFPTNFTVSTEDYPLARRLHLYLPVTTVNHQAQAFVNFASSQQGQQTVETTGLISQNIETIRPPVTANLPDDYINATKGAERLSVNIRFESGSNRIDNKGQRDLGRIAEFLSKNPDRRVMLLGFTDNVGDPEANSKLSADRAKLVGIEIMKLGIYPTLITGYGDAAPVASNDSEEGRYRNRRVEVWVI